ncbi:LLM class flavin-dependent oxidoreductase [Pseudonocardia spinosispora]|uniref:LLM class flavin-dependent oxidoreductase n=1 Tax=Pseudonocardia spinosispora TaxID=103441 RepID=UPI00040EE776|nr:LLM class flavin-dependent oxidoreductase [Pseudonocardia spinosispora]
MSTPLHLALEIDGDGAHPDAWRRAAHSPAELLSPRRTRSVAAVAENAGFTLVTLDDSLPAPEAGPLGRIGSVERAAFIAASTSVLGIAPVVSTTYAEPFHSSSQLASLDHISVGRAGWVVGTSPEPEAARAWGRPAVEQSRVAAEALDSVRVVRDLWDSWEDEAVIRDVATSRYLDRDRLHYIDFTGDTFAVKGPAIVPRSPQGQLVVFAPDGLLPAEQVDVTLVSGSDVASLDAAGRGTTHAFAEIELALDTPAASAAERIADLERHAPWPDRGRLRYTGGPDGLLRLLTELHSTSVTGVRLHPLVLDEDLAVLSQLVLPALRKTGLTARPVPGASLRTTLGLPRPANRFATAGGSR